MTLLSCSEDEVFRAREAKVDGVDYVVNMPNLTTDYIKTKKEFTKHFKDVKLDEKEDVIVIKTSNPLDHDALFKSITCFFYLSDGKYDSVNMAVTYSIENPSETAIIDLQNILREQTIISL